MPRMLRPSLNWLLLFLPVCVYVEHMHPESHTLIFALSCGAIIPLAGLLGKATEHIADRAGENIGGFLNATLGNAAELIIAIVALRQGLIDVVKASLTGSIVGNILLVLGLSFLTGGVRHKIQEFNAAAAQSQVAALSLASIGLIVAGIFHFIGKGALSHNVGMVSVIISAILLTTYLFSLIFSLYTHSELFSGKRGSKEQQELPEHQPWGLGLSLGVLVVSTVLIAWMSEILVGSVTEAANTLGMSSVFIGVIVVAMVGNAAEHSSAVTMALKNRMDLSLGIAIGSSVQIALFVAPLLVLLSYWIAPSPMNLVFTVGESLAVILSVGICSQIVVNGQSNWFEGVLLLAVYAILGLAFYFVPGQ
ncbi:MAG: calcium/proton exchanger [Thermodesulfobacteriota bacterium]